MNSMYQSLGPNDHFIFIICEDTFSVSDRGQYTFQQNSYSVKGGIIIPDYIKENVEIFHYKQLVIKY